MDKPQFRNVSLRDSLVNLIEDFIEKHPDFIAENPECKSIAGFVSKAALTMLRQLRGNGEIKNLPSAEQEV